MMNDECGMMDVELPGSSLRIPHSAFRILTYNLCFGGRDRVDDIHAVLAHTNASILALTEADDPQVVETLAARLEMHHVWERGSGDRHIALLSRFPILSSRIYNRPPLTQAVLVASLQLQSPNYQSEVSEAYSPPPEAALHPPLTLYAVHLLPYLLLPFEIRRWQAVGRLLEIIRADATSPHLILGDLNAIAPGDRVLQRNNPPRMNQMMLMQARLIFRLAIPRLLKAGYVDCYRATHLRLAPRLPLSRRELSPGEGAGGWGQASGADGFTWMTGNPTTRYDYIFADPTLASHLRDCRVVDDHPAVLTASDHYPLLATFEL